MKHYVIMKKYSNGNIKTSKTFTEVYDEKTLLTAITICDNENKKRK